MTVTFSDRPALRREMRSMRRGLSPRESARASAAIVERLVRLPAFRRARSVAGYWPVDGEPDVREALLVALARGAAALLPVLGGSHSRPMRFARWRPGWPLLRNRFGIPEPAVRARRFFTARGIDLVIAPLVAFDPSGHRLGLGGGYYDRTFAPAIGRARPWAPIIGVAYEHQRVPELEPAPWDVTLDMVVTERHIWRCR
jgi:5-formyltetrahydrofolate cyclo-ligase